MTIEELKKIVNDTDDAGLLDDLVIDEKLEQASRINSSGFDDQIDFLVEAGWTVEQIAEACGINESKTPGAFDTLV